MAAESPGEGARRTKRERDRLNSRGPDSEDLVKIIAGSGVRDPRVLDAFRKVPRALFVPPHLADCAYEDAPLPIPHGQVTTQPSLVAKMVEGLGLSGNENVLEVGTGYGFQTAILSHLAQHVWSLERWDDIAEVARGTLERFGADNVTVVVGDGSEGLTQASPFDAVLVSAAYPEVPQPLIDQLASAGRLVQPIGWGGFEEVILFQKIDDRLHRVRELTGAHFVRLYGRHGFADD